MGIACDILIHSPAKRKHITGETLKGLVKFHLDKETVYKKISLSLVEKGYCLWKENEHSYRKRYGHQAHQRRKVGNRLVFEGHETKTVKKIHLINTNTDVNTTLMAGCHEHEFEMKIPENIPPSLDTEFVRIKYYLELKFKTPNIFSRIKKFKTIIKILPSIDPSVAVKPLCFTLDKDLIKIFSAVKQKISLKVVLDKGYFNPSSERQILFFVKNNSNITISVKTELISKTNYKDDLVVKKIIFEKPKTVREVIYSCTVRIPSESDNSASCVCIMIPVASELYTVRHSKIISREYKLRVILKLPLPHINSSIEIPVFVGERRTGDVEIIESIEAKMESPCYLESICGNKHIK